MPDAIYQTSTEIGFPLSTSTIATTSIATSNTEQIPKTDGPSKNQTQQILLTDESTTSTTTDYSGVFAILFVIGLILVVFTLIRIITTKPLKGND